MSNDLRALVERLRALDASRKPHAAGGAMGQVCGGELYRIVASGNQFACLIDAADALEAAERDAAIGRAIQRAAGELPDDWEVELTVERGAASVYLRDPSGAVKAIDVSADDRLPAEIDAAIDAAIAARRGEG